MKNVTYKLLKMNLYQKWINHLRDNHMTYREHWMFAVGHGLLCCVAGIMLIMHGFLPCFFEHAGSNLVRKLKISFDKHRR